MSAIVGIFQTTPGHPSFCEIALLSQLPATTTYYTPIW